jgi:predicted MFS family arabinose efflux permease
MQFLKSLEDRFLLSPKLIYFVVCAAFYALHVFRAKFIKQYLGFGDDEYGDLCAVMALVSFSFMTMWGTLADALGRHRMVLVVLCLALAGSFELFLFVTQVNNMTVRFYLSAVVLGLYSFFSSGMLPITDFLTLRKLSNRPGFSRDLYGRQRLWGTISYGLMTCLVGFVVQTFSLRALFYLIPTSSVLCAICVLGLAPADEPKPIKEFFSKKPKLPEPKLPEPETTESGMEESKLIIEGKTEDPKKQRPIFQLLKNPNYLFMLIVVFMTGTARAIMTTFLSKYLEEGMKLLPTQVATAANFGIFLEVGIFFFGPACLRIFGIYWLLVFGQTAMVVRCWAYVVLPANPSNFWLVYLTELLKGVAFGFTQLAGVKLASDSAPKGLEATAQALYTSVYSQLPTVLSAVVGGRCYKRFGPNLLFYVTSIVSTVALGLFVLKYILDGSIRFPGFKRRTPPEEMVEAP